MLINQFPLRPVVNFSVEVILLPRKNIERVELGKPLVADFNGARFFLADILQAVAQNFVGNFFRADRNFDGLVAAKKASDRKLYLLSHDSISHKKSTVSVALISSG